MFLPHSTSKTLLRRCQVKKIQKSIRFKGSKINSIIIAEIVARHDQFELIYNFVLMELKKKWINM